MRRHDFDRLILHGGRVHTGDDAGRVVDAVGFAGGRVAAAGGRVAAAGGTLGADQAVSGAELLRMYTRGAAATLGLAGEIGQLSAGARADAVLLSDDLAGVPVARIQDVGVLATLAGRVELRP